MTTWRQLLVDVASVVGSASDARRMVEEASGYEGGDLLVRLDEEATARCGAYLSVMVDRRLSGEPLQYVLGRWGFRTLDLMVDRRVLIPRPETEQVVEWALAEVADRAREPLLVADLGTGSGAIALSLGQELARAEVWATDVSSDALDVARANLAGSGMYAARRIRMVRGSWWCALPQELGGRFDLVVSNPPYVATTEQLPSEVDAWEPEIALRAGADGLDAVREILTGAGPWMAPAGSLVVELSPPQAPTAVELALASGATQAEIRTDLAGRNRALVSRW